MTKPTFSAKLPDVTIQQLNELAAQFGTSKSQIVIQAVRQLHQQEISTMNTAQARQHATLVVDRIHTDTDDYYPVNGTIVAGHNQDGYWVTDNGEEVSGLSKEKAIEIIVENLTA